MTNRPTSVPIEALLSHAGWVRRIALHLTGDPDRADDLAQDAWEIALEHPPAPDARGPRAWLRTILSNLERRRRRDASLRAWHEARAARSEAVSAEGDVEEQVLLQRRLADAILGLAEPHRSAIVMRYLQGLPPREVARRQDISYDAARQRISRGLAMLRARLDREYGDRGLAWSALCATAWNYAHDPVRGLPWIPGGIAVTLQTKALTATAVLLLGAFLVWRGVRTDATTVSGPAAPSSSGQVLSASRSDGDARESKALAMERAPVPAASPARAVDRDRDLHGVVLDVSDKPIEGAEIAVYRNESDGYHDVERSDQRHPVGDTTTDARGEFAIEVPIGRPFEVEAGAKGYARARLGLRYAGEQVTIRLGEGATLFGRVTRASDGSPMPGAVLEVSSWTSGPDWTRIHKGKTDAEGGFRIEELPAGMTFFRVTPPTEGAPFRSRIELAPGQTREENVVIEEGLTIRGRVLDATSKEPLSDAEVGETGWVTRSVRTDADGEYVYRGIRREGLVRLEARAPGHGRQGYLFRGRNGSDDVPERRDFDLLREHRLHGRVIDGDGKPIEDAFVAAVAARRLDSPMIETDWIPGRTDGGGRFELAGLRADFAHSLIARKDGLGTVVYELPATESESTVIDVGDVVLLPMAVVRGSVVDEAGKAIPDQEVTLDGSNADRGRFRPERDPRDVWGLDYHAAQRTARTDDLGRFAFADLAAGEYRVETGLPTATAKVSTVVKVGTGERAEGVQLVLRALGRIAGILTDPEGRGIVGAGISARRFDGSQRFGSDALTDATGRFALEGLSEGSYELRISSDEFGRVGESDQRSLFLGRKLDGVMPGETDLKIMLQPGEWLHGRVLDADGRGVVSASVTARAPGLDESRLDFSGTDGRFKVPIPKGVAVDLTARPPVFTEGKLDGRRRDADPAHAGHLDRVVPSETEIVVKLPKQP